MATAAPPTLSSSAAVDGTGVGARVKALREGMRLSLRELGERAGVSAPMLSQVERGETSPTLAVAQRIASGLELSLSQLLRLDESEGVTVVRRDERRRGAASGSDHAYELLTPELPGQRAEVSSHVLRPGAVTGGPDDPPMHEPGSRETAVLIAGRLRLICAGVPYDLVEGDAVTFDADLPHRFENPGRSEARFMAVVTAGLRRS
jgi:transcriptional regulator with XRE-family HTH domain